MAAGLPDGAGEGNGTVIVSCHLCKFFWEPDGSWRDRPDVASDEFDEVKGECRFNPVSVPKRAGDWCGQFALKDPWLAGLDFRSKHRAWTAFYAERDRRREVEKKARLLRGKLRALKAAAPT